MVRWAGSSKARARAQAASSRLAPNVSSKRKIRPTVRKRSMATSANKRSTTSLVAGPISAARARHDSFPNSSPGSFSGGRWSTWVNRSPA